MLNAAAGDRLVPEEPRRDDRAVRGYLAEAARGEPRLTLTLTLTLTQTLTLILTLNLTLNLTRRTSALLPWRRA